MTADAAEKWLEEHAIRCDRFEMRVSPETCRRYQAEWPLRCEGCEAAGGGKVAGKAAQPVGSRPKAQADVLRDKAAKGGRRKAAAPARKKDAKAMALTFSGENREIMELFGALSAADGTDVADDVATVIELFMAGRLKLRH